MPDGLRQRKKRETRQRISDVATRLFFERGFDNVTVTEVAQAADVSKMTVFNYFPRKEDLFLDQHEALLASLREVVRGADAPVEALRRFCQLLLETGHPYSGAVEGVAAFWSVLQGSEALQNRRLQQAHEIEAMLARELRVPRPRLLGALLAATLQTIYMTAIEACLAGTPVAEVRAAQRLFIDEAFAMLPR